MVKKIASVIAVLMLSASFSAFSAMKKGVVESTEKMPRFLLHANGGLNFARRELSGQNTTLDDYRFNWAVGGIYLWMKYLGVGAAVGGSRTDSGASYDFDLNLSLMKNFMLGKCNLVAYLAVPFGVTTNFESIGWNVSALPGLGIHLTNDFGISIHSGYSVHSEVAKGSTTRTIVGDVPVNVGLFLLF